ncbi:MAG: CRTAC1 family protein [Gemmatimonadetes bacterium]|nr:CRTAC1 family protein [Gemmatimonadota bacterium]
MATAQSFRDVSSSAGIRHFCLDVNRVCGGVAFFDYNNDGTDDLYLTGGEEPDRLFRNEGDGTFRDVTKEAGLDFIRRFVTVGVATGDIDNDGFRDIFVTTGEDYPNILVRNNGDGTFSDISESAGIAREKRWSTAVTFGDYNLDGYLDIYVANYATYDGLPYDEHLTGGISNWLYRNNGDNTFDEVAKSLGVANPDGLTLAVAFTDVDGDHDVDLMVANDFGYLFVPNALFRNEHPHGVFTDFSEASATDTAINGMGFAIGDYDEDGDFDYYVTNMMGNVLYSNTNASGVFRESAKAMGIDDRRSTSWGAAFIDFDNDTDLDLIVANGRVLTRYNLQDVDHVERFLKPHENKLYRADGPGNFIDVSRGEGVADSTKGRGLAVADYDNDGDLDFIVAVVNDVVPPHGYALLYRNETPAGNHWLKVRVEGTTSNRDGFGSHIRVVAGGRTWIREIGGGSSYLSQNSSVAHFGMGDYAVADSLIVTWPGGEREIFTDIRTNQTVFVVEKTSVSYSSQQ